MIIEDTDKKYSRIYFPSLAVAVSLVFILLSLSSCEFFRKLDKSVDNKTEDKKVDSGFVRKNEVDTKRDSEYEKTTFIPVFPNDSTTVINNYIPAQQPSQPYIIIQEKGRASEQIRENNSDSMWNNRMDKLLSVLTEKKTETKGEFLSFWQIIGIAFIGIVFIGVLIALVYFRNQIVSIKTLLNK